MNVDDGQQAICDLSHKVVLLFSSTLHRIEILIKCKEITTAPIF